MFRFAASVLVLLSFLAPAAAQTPSATTASPAAAAPAKPAAKKPAKAKPVAKQPVAVESGPCRLGVISVIGERYSVQKFGLTIFENEETEVPIDWGLDDLVFARVKAATGAVPVFAGSPTPREPSNPFTIRNRDSFPILTNVCQRSCAASLRTGAAIAIWLRPRIRENCRAPA
jgi:hypothetical protein